jgi:pilus assembly protein Flp/PilA
MLERTRKFCADERGATALEYGLIVLVVALGIIGSLSTLPTGLSSIWSNVATNLN